MYLQCCELGSYTFSFQVMHSWLAVLHISFNNIFSLFPGVYREHFTDGEPDWLKEERKNFKEKLDKNGDGKLDKVTITCEGVHVSIS